MKGKIQVLCEVLECEPAQIAGKAARMSPDEWCEAVYRAFMLNRPKNLRYKDLTEKEKEEFARVYPNHTDAWLADRFHLALGDIHKKARILGLEKARKTHLHGNHRSAVMMLTPEGEVLEVFPSIKEAARSIGKESSSGLISECCRGLHRLAFGYRWMYCGAGMEGMV